MGKRIVLCLWFMGWLGTGIWVAYASPPGSCMYQTHILNPCPWL